MTSAPDPTRFTKLLARYGGGDRAVADEVYALTYDELHRVAERLMRGQRASHTLQATALVGEAFLKLAGRDGGTIVDRRHFVSLAASAMRSILVDHARAKNRLCRGGNAEREAFTGTRIGVDSGDMHLLELNEALSRLEELDAATGRIAELRCFGGMEHSEIAEDLDLSTRTVERKWAFAKAWLLREVG